MNDPRPEAMLAAVHDRGGKSFFLKYLQSLGGRLSRDAILAAISMTIAWGPLMRKRITRLTAETLPWYLRLYGVMIGASIPGEYHQPGSLRGISRVERFGQWSMADFLFLALTGKKPTADEARPLQILIGLLISNGPGAISSQGAKGAVSADGPQTPSRVQINNRELVQALYDSDATPYVFCVNVDAIIAALLLAVLWKDYSAGALATKDLETAAFNVFLYGRMIGAAAEIDDHLNRGRNMDTRTPLEKCFFVA